VDPIAPADGVETTFAIIKPDARPKAPEIICKLQEAGFTVAHSRVLTMTAQQARQFYAEHHGKNFFDKLISFMTSGECVVLALRKENAVADWRKLIGPTNSVAARERDPESLRALFGTDNTRNAVHGSSSVAAAMVELSFFFPKYFVYQRTVCYTLPGLSEETTTGIEDQFTKWGFTTMEKRTLSCDEAQAAVLAQQWSMEQPCETDPAEDDGSFLLPYLLRPHDPALDEPPAEKKPAGEDGEEPPPDEPADGEAATEEKPVCPEAKAMDCAKVASILASGEVTVYLLGRYGAVHALQCLTGCQDPAVARFSEGTAGTLRGYYAASSDYMAVHPSADAESARREIKLLFPEHCEDQLTLAIIKPDAVAGGHAATIRALIELNGFCIKDELAVQQTVDTVDEFYGEHKEKEFFPSLKEFMTGGKCIALALSRPGAIKMWRALIGPTNTESAKAEQPRSLRALFGTDGTRNACHGSDSSENGAREISILLPDYFKQQSTLAILKPDLTGAARHKVLQTIRNEGFFVQDEKTVTLSVDEATSFYALEGTAQGADPKAAAAHLASGPCVVMALSRPNAVRCWDRCLGPVSAKTACETQPNSLRACVAGGSCAVKNGCHGTAAGAVGATNREIAFFFPRLARSSAPQPGQPTASRYVEVELQPSLTKALTQLCKEKPPDPLRWLSKWLIDNNPNKPRVQLPPKPEKRPRGVVSKPVTRAAPGTEKEVVFIMGPTAGDSALFPKNAEGGPISSPETQAAMLATEFGFGHVHMPALIHEECTTGSELGKHIQRMMQDTGSVGYEELITLMQRFMTLSTATKFAVTGFPCNMDHVRGFEKLMGAAPTVLSLEPEGGMAALRDAVPSTTEPVLDKFEEETGPCLMYYQKKKMLTKVTFGLTDTPAAVFRRNVRKHFFKAKPKHFIFLLGQDAVGRATVADAIADKYEFRNINLGALMTDELIAKTATGRTISELLKKKRPIPTDISVGLLKEAIMSDTERNFVIDGFPLSVDELAALEKAVGVSCDAAVHLNCEDSIVQARIAAATGENAIAARAIEDARGAGGLAAGVLSYLKEEGKLVEVDANQGGEDVLADIEGAVIMGNFKERSKKVFVLGGPGAGKGTQCKLLVEKYGFVHLSAGDLLRAEVKSGSPHGAMISDMIRQGTIVPAEVTVGLLKAAMDKSMATRFLIDGFPRDHANVAAWEKSLGNPEFVLAFDCPEEELERRLLKRGETSGRSDDNAATIKKRFQTFLAQSLPVIDYYEAKGLVRKVSATGSMVQVAARTAKHFSAFSEVPDIIFVLGGPGSGKGTQCARISNEYGFVHLSAGDLLRAEIQAGSKDGALIAGMIREGQIVPQEITIRLIRAAMDSRPGCRFLIDGFPRALGQAAAFEEMVGHARMVLYFDASDEVLTERLLNRGKSSGRVDDNAEAIKKRLVTYHTQSQPVITAYDAKGMVKKINAAQSPDEVFADVEKALAAFRKQQIVLVLGQPLSGKTSLSKSLARTGMFAHVASADLMRAEVSSGSALGKKIADCVRSGKPVPPEIIVDLIKGAVAVAEQGKIIIDGFPRSVAEAQLLAQAIGSPMCVLQLDCEAGWDVVVHRNRADAEPGDEPALEAAEVKLKTRLEKYESETLDVVKMYEEQGLVKRIEAAGNDEETGEPLHSIHGTKKVYEQAATVFGL